eukprot:6637606-Alexandrium_andersonii.AAC.1
MWCSWDASDISVSSGPRQSVGTSVRVKGHSRALLARGSGPSQATPLTAACTPGALGPSTGETSSTKSR